MTEDLKCFLGLHHYREDKVEPLKLSGTDTEIGKVIVSRCTNCGKLTKMIVRTIDRGY